MSGMTSLLHVLSRQILAYLVFGIDIWIPRFSSLLAFFYLLRWWYIWHINIDVLGFVWGFGQSFFSIRLMFPINKEECCISLRYFVVCCPRLGTKPYILHLLRRPDRWRRLSVTSRWWDEDSQFFFFCFFCFWCYSFVYTHNYDNAHIYSSAS